MARVGRLAGAILAESNGEFYLIGNTKEPCDFLAAAFKPPAEIDALKHPYIKLTALGSAEIKPPCLILEMEGEPLMQALAERLLIERNGSVSDRLWRLIIDPNGEDEEPQGQAIDARWLVEIPSPIWRIVRDAVLRCL